MAPECHALLKSVCALKRVTVSEYVYGLIAEEFTRLVENDPVIREMFLRGEYPEGSRAQALKLKTLMSKGD